MNLGPKKRERLVAQALGAYRAAYGWSECDMLSWRKGISAVVDLLLSRQAEQVAPLLESLRVHARGFEGRPPCRKCADTLAAYEASQDDEKEPEPTQFDADTFNLVFGRLKEQVEALDRLLAREKGGKP